MLGGGPIRPCLVTAPVLGTPEGATTRRRRGGGAREERGAGRAAAEGGSEPRRQQGGRAEVPRPALSPAVPLLRVGLTSALTGGATRTPAAGRWSRVRSFALLCYSCTTLLHFRSCADLDAAAAVSSKVSQHT